MELVPCEFPGSKKQPKWKAYLPLLERFVASGHECCRIDGIDKEAFTGEVAAIRSAIAAARLGGKVRVSTREGVAYLLRNDQKPVTYR